ncbi:endoplasmic reticulum-Golgi intermediate compartment protein 3-like [Tritrichomonas foetus]|uniref:Endoplasmic reticulum-Golgi intermediate compartment protein 3-like n=1 Tax=Tritrichomonas foetus TaxID=1144522 RepID=A0A1J4K5X8_9EUKA|nr:endoplasmic reticulum-Golgi intermediate compartment protein 3-like [Tritrichomonas foetus]|eukprot:OHT06394.1 endoplasmic reticulum-Golgi intermediate compartment protein 3-like [Tritrichomonas foetus]
MHFVDFDIFPKLREDYSRQTTSSGIITFSCITLMSFLFISQTFDYFTTPPKQRLIVDETPLPTSPEGYLEIDRLRKMKIYFDITLHSMPCAFVNFGILDENKNENSDSFSRIKMKRFDKNGKFLKMQSSKVPLNSTTCGSCYGLKNGCCNTCKEVREAYKAKGRVPPPSSTIEQCRTQAIEYVTIKEESCQIYGTIEVPPDAAAFFISPADSYGERQKYITDYLSMGVTLDDFNMSHTITSFFISDNIIDKDFNFSQHHKNRLSPLDGITKVQKQHSRFKAMYFVRAIREKISNTQVYRTTVTHYDRYREGSSEKFPGLYFHYSVAPVIVEYKRDISFLHFLVDLMALLGGIFAIGTMIDHLTASPAYVKEPRAFG